MDLIIFILTVHILLLFKVYWDKNAKDSGRIINHSLSYFINAALVSATAIIFFKWSAFGYILAAAGYWWLVFDIVFNLINNWEWNNYGSSSKLDKFLINLGHFHLVPKITLIIGGIILIIFL